MKILKILTALSIILYTISCESEMDANEKIFKHEVENLSRILNKMEKIQPKKKIVKFSDNIEANYLNNEERKSFIEENKETLLNINRNLKQFSLENQNSKWADDSAFSRALAYIFVYRPNRSLFDLEDNIVVEVLNTHNKIQLENWTKNKLAKYYRLFAESIPEHLLPELSESEIIINGLYHFLISEFASNSEYQKAELIIEELKAKGANDYLIKSLKDLVEHYKSMEKLFKSSKDNQNSLN